MPTYTVVGLQDGGDLYVAAVFPGQQHNKDKPGNTDVYGQPMERFVGWFVAADPAHAEQMAREAVAWPYDNPDERAGIGYRDVTTIKPTGEIL